MLQPYKNFLIYTLILSIVLIPAQSLAAMAMDHGTQHATPASASLNHVAVEHQIHPATHQATPYHKVQTREHHAVAVKHDNHCQETESLCNQCNNCSHCINLIDCSNWTFTPSITQIEAIPPGIVQSHDSHLLLRPPIRS